MEVTGHRYSHGTRIDETAVFRDFFCALVILITLFLIIISVYKQASSPPEQRYPSLECDLCIYRFRCTCDLLPVCTQ